MFKAIGNFFRDVFGTPKEPVLNVPDKIEPPIVQLGPEKIEAPAPTKCGCGRSSTGFCVGLHKLTAEEWAVHADNPNKVVEAKPKKPRAKKVSNVDTEWPFKKETVKKNKPVKESTEKKTRTKKQ